MSSIVVCRYCGKKTVLEDTSSVCSKCRRTLHSVSKSTSSTTSTIDEIIEDPELTEVPQEVEELYEPIDEKHPRDYSDFGGITEEEE